MVAPTKKEIRSERKKRNKLTASINAGENKKKRKKKKETGGRQTFWYEK